MNRHNPIGYLVWGGLAYGLTKAIMDIPAWFGMHIGSTVEALLYAAMVFVAAGLLLYLYSDASEKV